MGSYLSNVGNAYHPSTAELHSLAASGAGSFLKLYHEICAVCPVLQKRQQAVVRMVLCLPVWVQSLSVPLPLVALLQYWCKLLSVLQTKGFAALSPPPQKAVLWGRMGFCCQPWQLLLLLTPCMTLLQQVHDWTDININPLLLKYTGKVTFDTFY